MQSKPVKSIPQQGLPVSQMPNSGDSLCDAHPILGHFPIWWKLYNCSLSPPYVFRDHNPLLKLYHILTQPTQREEPIKMSLFTRSNDALNINPPVGNRHLTVGGSDWLWAVCAIYSFSFLVVVGLTYFAKSGERIFHYLFTISLFTGAIAYFAMASDLGIVAVHISDNLSSPGFREIFYPKYINWYALLPLPISTLQQNVDDVLLKVCWLDPSGHCPGPYLRRQLGNHRL